MRSFGESVIISTSLPFDTKCICAFYSQSIFTVYPPSKDCRFRRQILTLATVLIFPVLGILLLYKIVLIFTKATFFCNIFFTLDALCYGMISTKYVGLVCLVFLLFSSTPLTDGWICSLPLGKTYYISRK